MQQVSVVNYLLLKNIWTRMNRGTLTYLLGLSKLGNHILANVECGSEFLQPMAPAVH